MFLQVASDIAPPSPPPDNLSTKASDPTLMQQQSPPPDELSTKASDLPMSLLPELAEASSQGAQMALYKVAPIPSLPPHLTPSPFTLPHSPPPSPYHTPHPPDRRLPSVLGSLVPPGLPRLRDHLSGDETFSSSGSSSRPPSHPTDHQTICLHTRHYSFGKLADIKGMLGLQAHRNQRIAKI